MKNKYVFISILAFATGIIVLNACRHEILDPVNGGGGTGGVIRYLHLPAVLILYIL